MPVGKISKSADGKTSHSEGGACHMGRAAQFPRNQGAAAQPVVRTELCRRIYTNHTHVVARCFASTGSLTFVDYELKREMSSAPDWMVDHMKVERTRCNAQECSAASHASNPSSWKLEGDERNLPHGPEVSYGIPFRWSTSR